MDPVPQPTRTPPSPQTKWDDIATSRQFQDLLAVKKLFIVPAFVFFVLYYFSLAVLVGYAPGLMSARFIGPVTFGYCFALSQFVMGWFVAWLYMKAAADFDKLSQDILDKSNDAQGGD